MTTYLDHSIVVNTPAGFSPSGPGPILMTRVASKPARSAIRLWNTCSTKGTPFELGVR